ncbi:helix-turn-helix transcriptional regulator [Glaciihabitans sp. INWT7]|uniref:helix-turn-helix transcriptional regulator n=1 Tax=Glaciihabitans sp. INWT7 TaxID=2596912 RepID=UPI00162481AB|nr:helix-turn-helix transcriptional regulator [Glaciihabitans sp. INWT7]
MMGTPEHTTDEWEARVGEQFRAIRIQQGLDQEALADRASISRGAVQNLESGHGSSLVTIIKVARALGRTEWLDTLDDTGGEISPIEMLRQKRLEPKPRQRVRMGSAS